MSVLIKSTSMIQTNGFTKNGVSNMRKELKHIPNNKRI